ncbi:hypothetical protein Zmor_017030 [Zophobas morio]|uniref:Uncharacterized protein n=1 Tax=Zophobas morio TaxID=2755281 RepID=A0AA38I820_9CUCU|nr:hypothetical protein Zmor_017030 [Zophobas morio]
MPRTSIQCCVPRCPGTGKILHRFPIPEWESVIIKEWVKRIANIQLYRQEERRIYTFYRVCDLHFSEHCRVPDATRLKKGSLPTLRLPGFKGPSNAKTSIMKTVLKPLNNKVDFRTKNVDKENCPQPVAAKKPSFFVSLKTMSPHDHALQEVCRVCFKSLGENNFIRLCDKNKEMNLFKNMLAKILPELDQNMYPGIVICSLCENLIVSSWKLKEMCSNTGEKLKQIIEKEEYTLMCDGTLVITELTPYMKILMDHNYAQKCMSTKKEIVAVDDKPQSVAKFPKEKIWGKGPYLCDKCGFSCAAIAPFRYHLVKHNVRRKSLSALCEVCGKVCVSLHSLKKHLRFHQIIYKCTKCSKVFITFRSLQTHYRTTHRAFQQCKFCAKVVKRGRSMKAHLLLHKYGKN